MCNPPTLTDLHGPSLPSGRNTAIVADGGSEASGDQLQKQCWYAVYTRARHEKCVAEQCTLRGVRVFLPLYCVQRLWKQRRAKVMLPLFPSYVFVRTALEDRL